MRSETYYTFTLSLYNITQSVDSVNNQPMFTPKTQFIRVIIIIDYFFLGIGSCLGGLSINDLSSWCIISDKGRSCSSLSLSSNCLTFSVVLNEINSDLLCLIGYIMLDKNNLNNNIYNIRLCMTIYEYI